jgi:hypothetical protein
MTKEILSLLEKEKMVIFKEPIHNVWGVLKNIDNNLLWFDGQFWNDSKINFITYKQIYEKIRTKTFASIN